MSSTAAEPPSLITLTTVLSLSAIFTLVSGAYVLSLRLLPGGTTPSKTRILFIWHAFDALTHLTVEASFLYNCFFVYTPVSASAAASAHAASSHPHSKPSASSSPAGSNLLATAGSFLSSLLSSSSPYAHAAAGLTPRAHAPPALTPPGIHFLARPDRLYGARYSTSSPTALLWQEYARSDARWAGADLTVVSLELLTVLVAGPLAAYVAYLLVVERHGHGPATRRGGGGGAGSSVAGPHAWFWIVVLATAELYGGFMTFAPEWLSGCANLDTGNWMFLWLYLVFFNCLWVVFPLFAAYEAFCGLTGTKSLIDERLWAKKVEKAEKAVTTTATGRSKKRA